MWFPGKNAALSCHFLHRGIFPTQGSNPNLLHWPVDSLPLSHPGRAMTVLPAKSLQSGSTLCDPMDCSPPCSSFQGILQARILEWVAISFSRGPSQPRDRTHVSCICCIVRHVLYHWRHLRSPKLTVLVCCKLKTDDVLVPVWWWPGKGEWEESFEPSPGLRWASLVVLVVQNPPASAGELWSLNWEDPLEKGMTVPSTILAWRIPWIEEPDGLQSKGLQGVRHDWSHSARTLVLRVWKFPVIFSLGVWSMWQDILERNGRRKPPTDHSPSSPTGSGAMEVVSHLCLHVLFPFFLPWSLFLLSSFLPLFFPRLLGRLEKDWLCYQRPALCHHLAGLRVRSREGQKKQGSCLGVFVCSLAGTMPSLKNKRRDLYIWSLSRIFILRS